jgi:hypothetical protein
MFVSKAKYETAMEDVSYWFCKYRKLEGKVESLLDTLESYGGLEKLISKKENTGFTDDDLKRLIQLCHPDKHSGSELSKKMTTMLNQKRAAK